MTLVWVEDDACRSASDKTRETVRKAWKRLFGSEMPSLGTPVEDRGDAFVYAPTPTTRVVESYSGHSIYTIEET